MATAKRWGLVLASAAALGSLGAGVHYHTTRPGCLPDLPCGEYVFGDITGPVSVFSLTPLELGPRKPGPPGVVRPRVKLYQMSQTTVALNHCSLSRVALTIDEGGVWTLSMRADQNPWMTGPRREVSTSAVVLGPVTAVQPPIPNLVLETEGLKRNQFVVKVRCYGAYPLRDAVPALGTPKPVLFELPPAMFWVQRGYPYDFWASRQMPAVAQYFDLIDRVEVEFSYR